MSQQSHCNSMNSFSTNDANSRSFGSDDMNYFRQKSFNEESINFIDCQHFKLRSFNPKKSINSKTSNAQTSKSTSTQKSNPNLKTKQIKKNEKHQHQNKYQNKFAHPLRQNINSNIYFKQISRHISNPNIQKNVQYHKPQKNQFVQLVNAFDWMMELASLMKLTKSCFYRAVMILDSSQKVSSHVLEKTEVQKYVCACLLISAKFDDSNIKYLDLVYLTNCKRILKQQITKAQVQLYQLLKWKIPTASIISEQILQILKKWNAFLNEYEYPFMKQQTMKKLIINIDQLQLQQQQQQQTAQGSKSFNFCNSNSQSSNTKLYGQILYLLDVIILNQTRRYLSPKQNFRLPIIIALYSSLTISLGDYYNKDEIILPLLNAFCRNQLKMDEQMSQRMNKEIKYNFFAIDFANCLSKIPLMMAWQNIIQNDCQVYISIINGSQYLKKGLKY